MDYTAGGQTATLTVTNAVVTAWQKYQAAEFILRLALASLDSDPLMDNDVREKRRLVLAGLSALVMQDAIDSLPAVLEWSET